MESNLQAGTRRKSGWLSMKNLLTIVVIVGCGALIAAVALYALSTQKQHPDIGDGGFLSEEPCGPPCLLQIRAGETSSIEAEAILQGQAFAASCGESPEVINCQDILQIGFQDGVVNMVSFKPSFAITLNKMLGKYGPPDRILVFISSLAPGGHPASKMRLFYDRISAMIDLPDQNDVQFTVEPGTIISNIAYLSEAEYASYQQQIGTQARNWQGYRSYQADVQP